MNVLDQMMDLLSTKATRSRIGNKASAIGLVVVLTVALTACGSSSSPPTQSRPTSTRPAQTKPTSTQPAPTEPPRVDVAIVGIDLPSRVTHGQMFQYTVKVKNVQSNGKAAPGWANVDVRAQGQSATASTNVSLGSSGVRDLGPNQTATIEIQAQAPPFTALWDVTAVLSTVGFVDSNAGNNRMTARLVVD